MNDATETAAAPPPAASGADVVGAMAATTHALDAALPPKPACDGPHGVVADPPAGAASGVTENGTGTGTGTEVPPRRAKRARKVKPPPPPPPTRSETMSNEEFAALMEHYWEIANARKKRVKPPPPPPPPLTWSAAIEIAKKGGDEAIKRIQALWQTLSGAPAHPRPSETEGSSGAATPVDGAPDLQLDAARGELAELLGLGVNTKSNPQVIALLDRLKLPKVFKRGRRDDESARTKDADVLLDLYLRTGHPITVALLKCISLRSQMQELERTRDSDGRIRTSFVSCGTPTDRTTSQTFLTGSGGNLQTIPKPFRSLFIPD